MKVEPKVYLLINGGEWWDSNNVKSGMLRIISGDEAQPKVKTVADLLDFEANSWSIPSKLPLVLCYQEPAADDDEGRANNAKCRQMMRALMPKDSKVRVFYHRRGDFKTLNEIQDDFHKHFWSSADVMPHSLTNFGFPWIALIRDAKAGFLNNAPQFEVLFDKLDLAWNTAFTFYHIDQPTRVLMETLFPLFVDLSNHEINALTPPEFSAACSAARKDLETRLAGIMAMSNTPARDLFKDCLQSIKDSSPADTKGKCAVAGFDLLKLLENLTFGDNGAFKEKFKELSKAYSLHLGLGLVAPPGNLPAPATA